MWWGSGSDPDNPGGEGSKEPPQNQQLLDLQEQFEQQQTFIAQLKEMLRKTEESSSVSREKVEEYASTLSEINARAKLSKIKRNEGRKSDSEASSSKFVSKKSTVVTPAKEKINLLRQQLEENRVKLAERDKNQRDMEDLINQLKTKIDDSQTKSIEPLINPQKIETKAIFSSDSSKEELLFALKSKDDHILELNDKLQQLQANVLDLQENIKEKDSVIDARTKAITLLSENLSKKGKHTLDLLEETKGQMRDMQQNFVTLEAKMKEENTNLQSELTNKEKEILELTANKNSLENQTLELNMKLQDLQKINDEYSNKIQELEESSPQKTRRKKSKNKETEVEDSSLQTKITELENLVKEYRTKLENSETSEEVTKLNKQLEDMNKNMIKMKAQHKAKLKEMQKKNPSELNEKISVLESENLKLGHRVAELEDEKGNLQLRLVEFESNKEKEYIADLENRIEEQKMEIENHIRTITSLESQITTSSNELSSLRSELSNLMHIENAQVCSEMTSVQLEEQLDKEVSQKKEIQDKYNEIIRENESLLEKIENLNKEKQELSGKLDQYMQENIDLIDRLEKLSAEKVSSAESIEIVDALTQQEKMEIEAYQKNLDFDKPSDIELDPNLNESVSKLNEETSELMQRIELFTTERREVMEKMDHLSMENQQLLIKIEKIETEKSDLNELCDERNKQIEELNQKISSTEKIQEELLEYRALLENQKIQIASLQEELWNKSDNEAEKELNNSLTSQLRTLRAEFDSLYSLSESQKADEEKLITAKTELEEILTKRSKELEDYKTDFDQLKESFLNLENALKLKENAIEILENEALELSQTIGKLNNELEEKEKSNNNIVTSLSLQLDELKSIISDNFEQLQQYETEINKNSGIIEELNEKLEELNYKFVDCQHIIELKNVEINTLKAEKTSLDTKILNLEKELKEKDDNFAETCRQLKEKCKVMENQIETNTGSIDNIKQPFEAKIKELETKNKEQVEKMKKIAANLKKKSALCQQLETQVAEFKEKWENEEKEQDKKQKTIEEQKIEIADKENEIHKLMNELQELQTKINDKNLEINNYETLQNETEKLKENLLLDVEKKTEELKSNENKVDDLKKEVEALKMNLNAVQAKLQEKDLYIENIETENNNHRENYSKLIEKLSKSEEVLQKSEDRMNELQILEEERFADYEKAVQSKNLLEQQIKDLISQKEEIEEKLQHSLNENQLLNTNLQTLTEENNSLQNRNKEILVKLQETSDSANQILDNKILDMEEEMKRLQTEYERKLNEKANETEKIESDLISQLEEANSERIIFINKCEKLQNNIKEYIDNEQVLNEEIDNLKQNISNLKQDLDQKIEENSIISQQLSSGNSLDLQVLQTEIDQLKSDISQKEIDIQNYQRQNMQLQMASFNSPGNLFDSSESEELKKNLTESNNRCLLFKQELENVQIELQNLQKLHQTAEEEFSEKQKKLLELQELYEISQNELEVQKKVVLNLQKELAKQAAEEGVKEIISTAEKAVTQKEEQKMTKEELLRKINALEFMLFNVEKEKDETLAHCHEFTNELTRLVYEREKLMNPQQEEEIIKEHVMTLEHDPVPENKDKPESYGSEDQHIKEIIESEILPVDATKFFPEDKKQFDLFQYGKVSMPQDKNQNKTVTDHISDPKHMYVCYPSEDTFASEEDGWGWNAEEAKLEAEHRMSLGAVPVPTQTDSKVEQLEEKIHDLEVERSRLLEEIKTSQVRSGKLIKKIKLLKEKNDSLLANKKSDDSFGLDLAIQDELNTQIKTLERRIKELTEENTKEKSEKDNLIKRLDVLTAANDRMVELKEKQDNEIQFLQFKNRELSVKLEQLEWGDSPERSKTPTTLSPASSNENTEERRQNEALIKKIAELNSIINDLTLDNEEMQCMLEEQRNMRVEAEKALSNRPVPENMKSEQEFQKVESENKNLQEELSKLNEVKQILEDKINHYVKNNEELTIKSNNLQIQLENIIQENQLLNNQFEVKLQQTENENKELQNQIMNMNAENDVILQKQIEVNQYEISQLKLEIHRLENNNRELQILLEEKEIELYRLNAKILELESDKSALENRLQEFLAIQSADKTNDEKLQEMNDKLMIALSNLDNKNKEITELNNLLINERSESEQKIKVTIEQLAQEWAEKVDQRGNEVAESWKLHLESVENEFTQKESNLKSELNKLFYENEELVKQNNNLQEQVQLLTNDKQDSSNDLELKNKEIVNLQLLLEQMQSKESDFQLNIQNLEEKLQEMNALSQEEEKQLVDLKKIIENQVLKIEELKTELKQKDDEYNALAVVFDKLRTVEEKPEKEEGNLDLSASSESSTNSAAKAELDLALYMLHQRDVRCEELTVELMQLLEERDTLQLKLSNAIRTNEELRSKVSENSPKAVKSTGAIPKSKSKAIVLDATKTELATEAVENVQLDPKEKDELADKLSQLRLVGYRDKTLKDDQEIRHIQQMTIMQQHRDLASKLPPEAAARLVDASYTVSRDVQSPSKVLLNWLWGRSTPKVNDV